MTNVSKRNSSKNTLFFIFLAIATIAAIIWIFFRHQLFPSEYEYPNQQNNKMVTIINNAFDMELRTMNTVMSPGLIPEAQANAKAYLRTIKQVEAYASDGVENTNKFNKILLRIEYTNGEIIGDIYTGRRCYNFDAPCLVMKFQMQDGLVTQVWTNGVERQSSVEHIKNDLQYITEPIIRTDKRRNPSKYVFPNKTAEDIEQEWKD